MDDLEKIFNHIKTLANKRFFGKVNLIFESGRLVHSEITQKLKPEVIIIAQKAAIPVEVFEKRGNDIREKITVLTEST